MKLNKLYTTPTNLFEPVVFHNGINFIFGVKDETDESLNGIGKSLLLDFLDFVLLAGFNHKNNTRLNRAYEKGILKKHSVVLEFEINKIPYKLTRSFDEPQLVWFSINGGPNKDYSIRNIYDELFGIVYSTKYKGYFESSWFRRITKFFLKIQKVSDEKFTDPIKFTSGNEIELNQYHLFLLNLDNTLANQNYSINSQIDNYRKTASVTRQFLLDKYKIKDLPAAQKKAADLQKKIKRYQEIVTGYNIKEEYQELESRLDTVTSQIKSLILLNSTDQSKIHDLDATLQHSKQINSEHVEMIYKEFDSLLAVEIKKNIDEPKEFRSSLLNSRQDFVQFQKSQHQLRIKQRNQVIEELGTEQTQIMNNLSSLNALPDLKTAFKKLTNIQTEKAELQSKINMFKELNKEIQNLKSQDIDLLDKVDDFISENEKHINNITSQIKEIYTVVFGNLDSEEIFTIVKNKDEQKLKINILPDDVYSHGKNQGRTLIYDLSVLFNAIKQNIPCPRFLVHDGIFDSLDKSHFISLYQFCEQQLKKGVEFQYIVTMNEQGSFDERFGNKDNLISRDSIIKKSIRILSPSKKLLGVDFK